MTKLLARMKAISVLAGALFFAAYCLLAGEVSVYLNIFTPDALDMPAWLLTGAGWLVGAAVVFAVLGMLTGRDE